MILTRLRVALCVFILGIVRSLLSQASAGDSGVASVSVSPLSDSGVGSVSVFPLSGSGVAPVSVFALSDFSASGFGSFFFLPGLRALDFLFFALLFYSLTFSS